MTLVVNENYICCNVKQLDLDVRLAQNDNINQQLANIVKLDTHTLVNNVSGISLLAKLLFVLLSIQFWESSCIFLNVCVRYVEGCSLLALNSTLLSPVCHKALIMTAMHGSESIGPGIMAPAGSLL